MGGSKKSHGELEDILNKNEKMSVCGVELKQSLVENLLL